MEADKKSLNKIVTALHDREQSNPHPPLPDDHGERGA
jgi:hypothetical protein